jgi:hypothetical protein
MAQHQQQRVARITRSLDLMHGAKPKKAQGQDHQQVIIIDFREED